MNILLADSQPRVRSALRLLLEQQSQAYRIEEADILQGMSTCVRSRCPDILMVDWKLLGTAPEKALGELQASCPGLIIIAMDSDPQIRSMALKAGVDEFVSKNDPPERLLSAIEKNSDFRKRDHNAK